MEPVAEFLPYKTKSMRTHISLKLERKLIDQLNIIPGLIWIANAALEEIVQNEQ